MITFPTNAERWLPELIVDYACYFVDYACALQIAR